MILMCKYFVYSPDTAVQVTVETVLPSLRTYQKPCPTFMRILVIVTAAPSPVHFPFFEKE